MAGVITNQMAAHNLGTRIKNDIILIGLRPVSGTEWFSVETTAAWKLFRLNMNHYDGTIVNDGNYRAFCTAVLNLLRVPCRHAGLVPARCRLDANQA